MQITCSNSELLKLSFPLTQHRFSNSVEGLAYVIINLKWLPSTWEEFDLPFPALVFPFDYSLRFRGAPFPETHYGCVGCSGHGRMNGCYLGSDSSRGKVMSHLIPLPIFPLIAKGIQRFWTDFVPYETSCPWREMIGLWVV